MNRFQDAFISYGRADSKMFAQKLNDYLVAQGLEVWFDFEDIPLGVDYQKQIDDGIDKADNFAFVIAPHSVNSPYCRLEIERALQRHKRIIPILHVEQISREVWQQRFPTGQETDWLAYQAKGLHSSFPNMHPEIAKINWVYCREGQDDLTVAFANILTLFEQQRLYVHQHTYLLAKALDWERNHKRTQALLVGEERTQAEAWLKTQFTETQPPCQPTRLHCEFITESTKNANNLMTQVFLAWAEGDRPLMEPIRHRLMREGFTLWVSKTDIETGADFVQLIRRGIEEADNIVYLISPESLASPYCQDEINYALSLHKRIIPLLMRAADPISIPEALRSLQYIDFADNTTQQQFDNDIAKLIRILRQEADDYETHKLLLTKALKWDRQHRNPCILLRGYNLRHAEAWLKVAQQRDQHRPVALLEEFIQESLRQPSGITQDVFISYSRKDSEFARKLNDALQRQGKTTWFDQESIAAGNCDFQQEIYRGIENSSNIIFVISPCSIESPYCADEVDYAVRLNKRITTVLYQPVKAAHLPSGLASIQWIDFSHSSGNFDACFSTLLRTLDNDPAYLTMHTNLLVRSLEWENRDRDESLLLRGRVLREVREWLLTTADKQPQPTRLQRDFVTASNDIEIKRQRATLRWQRWGIGAISLVSLAAIASGLLAFKQYRAAETLKVRAQTEEVLARSGTSNAMFQSDQALDALLEAMQAGIQLQQDGLSDPSLRASVVTSLQQAMFWVRERLRIAAHDGIVWSVRVSPDGERTASASGDGSVKLWDRQGRLVRTLKSDRGNQMLAVAFSPNGKELATAESDGHLRIWHLKDWTSTPLQGGKDPVGSLAFSPDGRLLAAASEDSLVRLWQRPPKGEFSPRPSQTLEGHDAAVRSVAFSPNGQQLASASDDATVRLWTVDRTASSAPARPLKTLVGHTAQVRSVAFSPNGQKLVSGSWDETLRLWSKDGAELNTLPGPETLIHDAQFTPDGRAIAAAGWDKTTKIWTLDGKRITTLAGHTGQVRSIAFNPKSGLMVSSGGDRTLRFWQLRRPLLAILQDHHAKVYGVSLSPDGQRIASVGADNLVRLWDRTGKPLKRLSGHQSVVWSVQFSPNGQRLLSTSSDYTVKLWTVDGRLLKTLVGHAGPVYDAEFSPDGRLIASTGADQTIRLWNSNGTPIRTLEGFKKGLLTVRFSPDGKTLAIAGWENTVRLITLDGKPQATLKGHQGWVYDVAFSPDGQQLLTGSYDGTAKLWTQQGKLLTTLKGHEDGIVSVAFSVDGQFIVTASHDHTVKVWQRDGTLITTLRGHSDRVNDVSISHDDTLLATASEDQTVLLWSLDFNGDLKTLLADGCQWTRSYLNTRAGDRWPTLRTFCQ
jgi:WD40 repeat protein